MSKISLFSNLALSALLVFSNAYGTESDQALRNVTPDLSFARVQQDDELNKQPQNLAHHPIVLELQEKIGYRFKNPSLLVLALRSECTDIGHTPSSRGYERLEFEGDAVLELVMREFLFNEFPFVQEFRAICSTLVNGSSLAPINALLKLSHLSKEIGLSKFNPDKLNDHTNGNFVESLIGALYEDGGLEAVRPFVQRFWKSDKAPETLTMIFRDLTSINARPLRVKIANPVFRRIALTGGADKELALMGEAIFKLVLRDFLCKRFPKAPEGVLVRKHDSIVARISFENFCHINGTTTQAYQTVLGLLYFDQGLKACSDHILWELTNENVPKAFKTAIKKAVGTDETVSLVRLPPTLKALPPFKNALQELLLLRMDKPEISNIPDGPPHDRIFKVCVSSQSIGNFEAQGKKLKDAEEEACRLAFTSLSTRIVSNLLISREEYLKNDTATAISLKTLESLFFMMGLKYSYYSIALREFEDKLMVRVGIEGKELPSRFGDGATVEIAKANAALSSLMKLFKMEHKKLSNEDKIGFYFEVCEHILKAKGLICHFEPSSKDTNKLQPKLDYLLKFGDKEVHGQGYTPLQAKLDASVKFIHQLMPELKLLSRIKVVPLELVQAPFVPVKDLTPTNKYLGLNTAKVPAPKVKAQEKGSSGIKKVAKGPTKNPAKNPPQPTKGKKVTKTTPK